MRKTVQFALSATMAFGLALDASAQNAGAIGTGSPEPAAQSEALQGPGVAALGNSKAVPSNIPGGDSVRPVIYQDPNRGYLLVAPPGSQIKKRADVGQVMIQSRRGYGVNVQAGTAKPSLSTQDMFAKLESQYMGEGKPWARKFEERYMTVAGLPGAISKYEAGSTRTSVVIARGKNTDFVFMFFAPVDRFERLSPEFDLILASFRPAKDEMLAKQAETSKERPELATEQKLIVRAENMPEPIPSVREKAKVPSSHTSAKVFSEAGYGYRVEYPLSWSLEKISAFTNVISGPKGTAAYDAIIALQNVKSEIEGDGRQTATSVFEDLKQRLSQKAAGLDFVGEKAVTYTKFGHVLEGRQFVANYAHNGRVFRKWALVLPRPDGNVAHIWSYTAPRESFDRFRPVAEQVLNSLQINSGG